MIRSLIRLSRPKHWTKNVFVGLPLFFSGHLFEIDRLIQTILAFCVLCIVSSMVYVFNDIRDQKEDRNHPEKRHRPIASGKVSTLQAYFYLGFLSAIALIINLISLAPVSSLVVVGYIIINLGYSFGLKNVAVVDSFIVAFGFVARVLLGAVVTAVALSSWIVVMTFLLSLLLALGKRKDDLRHEEFTGKRTRLVVDGYNHLFLDISLAIMVSIIIVSYLLYSMTSEVVHQTGFEHFYISAIFVVFGMLSYLQRVIVKKESADPIGILFVDRKIQAAVALWIGFVAIVIYWNRMNLLP